MRILPDGFPKLFFLRCFIRLYAVYHRCAVWCERKFVAHKPMPEDEMRVPLDYKELEQLYLEHVKTSPASPLPALPHRENPRKLGGSFWNITTYFNPTSSKLLKRNYDIFRRSLKAQGGLLLAVEHVHGDDDFELASEDADILVQLRGGSLLWQKERLLNLAISRLPAECDKVAWLDADVVFNDDNWIAETAELLERYTVLQPFSFSLFLPKNCAGIDLGRISSIPRKSLIHPGYYFGRSEDRIPAPIHFDSGHLFGSSYKIGFAWAARRKLLEQIPLYEGHVVGAGDEHFTRAAAGGDLERFSKLLPPKLANQLTANAAALRSAVNSNFSFRRGLIIHLWHGHPTGRQYVKRHKILRDHDFDPANDIRVADNGALSWASDKPGLHAEIEKYFRDRTRMEQ